MANKSFQLVVDDTSPTLSYFPISDTLGLPNLFAGWNPAFSDSGFASIQGQQGNGTSSHVTSLDGAAFSVQWFGTAIQLFGNLTGPATYDLSLDGQSNSSISSFSPSDPTLLASYDQLPQGDHVLSLSVHNPTNSSSALIAIDRAVLTASASPNASITEFRVDDTELAFVGQWSFLQDNTLTSNDTSFHTSTHAGDSFSYNFTGSAVAIAGFRDAPSGRYTVRLDGDTFFFDGRSSFRGPTTLFIHAGLAPNVTHNMSVINTEDRLLAIGSIDVTSVVDSTPSTTPASTRGKSNVPTAAIAVASVLGFIVALLIAFYIWRRRRHAIAHRRRASPEGSTHSNVLDIAPEHGGLAAYKQEDKNKGMTREGSGNSVSFTLDLPIQSRPSRTSTHSGNSVQEIPRSPTVSQMLPTREGTHASAGQELAPPHPFIDLPINSPFEVQFLPPLQTRGSSETSFGRGAPLQSVPQDLSQSSSGLGDARPSSALLPLPTPPRVHVTPGTPEQGAESEAAHFSFLDFAPSTHEGTSSSSSRRRLSEQTATTASNHRPISLGYAFGYHHNTDLGMLAQAPSLVRSSSVSSASPTSPVFTEPPSATLPPSPQEPASPPALVQQSPPPLTTSPTSPHTFTSPIRPLPRIPLSPPIPMSASSSTFPRTPPALQLQTHFESPDSAQAPAPPTGRGLMSATTTGLTSAFGSNTDDGTTRLLQLPSGRRPSSAVSPTDSIPVTVSDIHFRHSSDDDDRTTALEAVGDTSPGAGPSSELATGRSERRGYASPFIMQKLLGGRLNRRSPESPLQPGDRHDPARDSIEGPTFAPGLERPDKPTRRR